MFIAKENLFLNADKTKVVKEGDKVAAFLLTTTGAAVSAEDVKAYSLEKYVEESGKKKPAIEFSAVPTKLSPRARESSAGKKKPAKK